LALPLVAIGIFALWGGLRFTVYAVPVAAMSAVFLFCYAAERLHDKKARLAVVAIATGAMLYPNITHILNYKVPTVLNKSEVQDLVALDKIASEKDYTIGWWDYGYPIWYYSDTNTLIDGGKHNDDNFIVSKILQTDSPALAAHLARLSVETYVKSGYRIVTHTIFKERDPNELLAELENDDAKLPRKTRDIYLYLPFRMLNIFPTVMKFGNLDLKTGEEEHRRIFMPMKLIRADERNGKWYFSDGTAFDLRSGKLVSREGALSVRALLVAALKKDGSVEVKAQPYREGRLVLLYLRSYNIFVLTDMRTFKSTYVQMFMLGRYDKRYFEPVVVSPYTRIYRVKR
jgi:dolichyl-diphosphooligosaccharide--protein glycosyltransferase/undecaprenyl-diphosphooligosaccharide--protein glycosyltransferase